MLSIVSWTKIHFRRNFMPLDANPHQTVTRIRCVGFSMYGCGFSVSQMRQFYLFAYPPRSRWALSEKMIFFNVRIFRKSVVGPLPTVVQACTQPYSFGGRIKLISCQIRPEKSVTIHEISSSWKKTLETDPILNLSIIGVCSNSGQ